MIGNGAQGRRAVVDRVHQLRRIFGPKDGFDDRDQIVPVDAIGHAIPSHGLAASHSVRQ